MNKTISTFFKTQLAFNTSMIAFIVLPYYLSCSMLPKIPYLHYFFLIIIFVLKIIVLDEQNYGARIKNRVTRQLLKESGKHPSRDQIFKRIEFSVRARDFSLLVAALSIITMAIIFKKL